MAEQPDNSTAPTGYRESADHVPDPTAISGTLETSGTGGGRHETLTGTTGIFGDAEDMLRKSEAAIQERLGTGGDPQAAVTVPKKKTASKTS